MNVLYVSKALVVAAYRDKLLALSAHARVTAVVPHRWGAQAVEAARAAPAPVERCRALLHGHNHLHLYWRPERLLERHRPDLVHIDEEPYSAATFQLAALCARRGVPCLFFAWQNLDKRLPPPFAALRAAVFRRVAGGIAGTERAAEVLRRAGYRGPLAVIPQFGVSPERFRPDAAARAGTRARLGVADGEFVVGYAGRLLAEKGVHLLPPALRELPRARLVVLGDGPERARLRASAQRCGLAGRVHFAPAVASERMPAWLAAFDVLALPSLSRSGWVEQFGRVLVEAMACGVPVVGSDSGEIPRVIGDAGQVVPEGDARALGRALAELAAAPELRARLAQRGRARACALFSQERVAAATAAFYTQVLASGGGG